MSQPAPDLATLRRRIAELGAERARIAAAPPPERDALARIEADVATLGASAPPVTASNLDALLRIKPGATLAKLLPEQLARTIAEDMRLGYASMTSKPLTPAARAKELARIDDQLLAAEVAEERTIRDAEDAGRPIDRRADASPEVVLMEELA